MEKKILLEEWGEFTKKAYNIYPSDTYGGVNSLKELVSLRNGYLDRLKLGELSDFYSIQELLELKEYFSLYYKVITFQEYKDARIWNNHYLENYQKTSLKQFRQRNHEHTRII